MKAIEREFYLLSRRLAESGCEKKQTACGVYVDGKFWYATNYCAFNGSECPRLTMPSGEGYELCSSVHAETSLAMTLKVKGLQSDGIAWLVGHYWICEPCATALKDIGVKEIRIRESVTAKS